MRHRIAGKQLSRTTSHRKALRRNMASSLFEHGAIRTTEAKAKELRRFVERLITIARQGTLYARRRVIQALGDRMICDEDGDPTGQTIIQKLFDEVAPRYVDRPGGYTRIIRLQERRIGDAGVQVIIQLVEEAKAGGDQPDRTSRRKRRAVKRHEAASAVPAPQAAGEQAPAEEAAADEAAEAPAGETQEAEAEEKKDE